MISLGLVGVYTKIIHQLGKRICFVRENILIGRKCLLTKPNRNSKLIPNMCRSLVGFVQFCKLLKSGRGSVA